MPTPPHLILVVVDGLGWRMTGWSDNPYAETPFMDKLVKDDSLILDRMYGQANCAPARAALLTGRVAARAGILNYPVSIYGVSEKLTLLPERLKQAGYATHAVGQWGVGMFTRAKLPHGRGFDSSFGYMWGTEDHYSHTVMDVVQLDAAGLPLSTVDFWTTVAEEAAGGIPFPPSRNIYGDGECHPLRPNRVLHHPSTTHPACLTCALRCACAAALFRQRALDVIRLHPRAQPTPLFLYLALQSPAPPWQAPAEVQMRIDPDYVLARSQQAVAQLAMSSAGLKPHWPRTSGHPPARAPSAKQSPGPPAGPDSAGHTGRSRGLSCVVHWVGTLHTGR